MASVLEQCVEVIEEVKTLKDVFPPQMNKTPTIMREGEQPRCLLEDGRVLLTETLTKLEVYC